MSVSIVRKCLPLAVIGFLFVSGAALKAQDNQANGNSSEDKGATATEIFSGSSNSISGMLKTDTNIGWNFTQHFGVDVGVPYLFNTRPGLFAGTSGRLGYVSYPYVSCSYYFGCYEGVATSSRIWTGELGDVYTQAHYIRTYKGYNFATNLTGDAPTASFRKGLTSGRAQWDWFNHIDTNLHGFDPFVNFGLANGRMDQHFMPRPYDTDLPFRTFGYLSDFEGGVQYKLWNRIGIGFSVWDVLPMGPQRIFSNLVWDQPGEAILAVGGPATSTQTFVPPPTRSVVPGNFGYLIGDPNHGRYWNTAFESTGPAYIARDNGYSATLDFTPTKTMDVLIAYNHSVRYALDTVSFTVQFNANSLVRKLTNR
jgi:hypothetical protein